RAYEDLVLACQNALTEFEHTDFERARIYDHQGDALEELGRPTEARAAYHKSIAAFPSRDHPWRGLGWSFWNTSDYPEAVSAFRTALDLGTTAESLAGLGSSLRRQDSGNEEVADLFERALLISPEYTWVMVEQGWMFFFRAELEDAANTFRTVLDIDSEYTNAAYGLSRTLARDDELDGALDAINDALLIDNQSAVYVTQRARVLRRLGRKNLALSEARKAMVLDPEDQDGFVEAARALRDLGRMAEGYTLLDAAIDKGVGSNFLYYAYASMLADEENWDASLVMMEKALTFPDVDERDHNMRAFILLRLERNQEALVASQTSLALAPDNPTALLNVAYAELALGNTEVAVRALLTANETGVDASDINEFIAYVLSHGRYLLAARLRIEISKQNLKEASKTP
ncbi:MAG: tetratricopeptide repeat protein, partial [Alphaproteobacteria bacterium]|nr:tetratricopeptide repeat protein [Alphaproteobacteria bacterium]